MLNRAGQEWPNGEMCSRCASKDSQHVCRYPQYEVNGSKMRNWEDAILYWHIYGGTLMEKIDFMTPWHVLKQS